ncbi:hypothetical protein [Lacinutrix sp. MedPE-SW]|uniref:LIC_10190 family membrane protein n=1 Tax=Lacinutrix sp. MedPE-SW TaxID=1860087 RepID=UPI00091A228C|nr:hypothetical protein [Lacinutrix sp. MedPE-SW]OIQ23737.1 MAG: hypothetical protein BM549_00065 [Lacinutrix sp. MedPE-SW]
MLLILLSWIYIFATTLVFGVATAKLFRIQAIDTITAVFIGSFTVTLCIGFWSIFNAVNTLFYIVFFVISLLLYLKNKTDVYYKIKQLKTSFLQLTSFFKGFIIFLLFVILAKCASAPFLLDNETYYIQTIKWLNQYGFTKGLTNLHLFLGQTSGWHILQSGYNFEFIYSNLNDLSGFCLFLGNVFAIEKLNNYVRDTTKNKIDLIIGLFPIFNVFLFQFIGAPSPDIAIYVLGIIIFYEFLSCYKMYNIYSFHAVFLLSVFATFIKLTGFIYFVLALVLYFHYYKHTKKDNKILAGFGIITLVLFLVKNTIITGNPFYPLHINFLKTNWSLPNSVSSYFSVYEKAASYGLDLESYNMFSFISRLKSWVSYSLIDGVFNASMLILLLITPLFILKLKQKKPILIVYFSGVFAFIILLFIVPQYRFFFQYLILFSLIVLSSIIKHKHIITLVLSVSLITVITSTFLSFNLSNLTNTQAHNTTNSFSFKHIITPYKNSKYKMDFETINIENTTIHSPVFIDFFWATGELPLPALNKAQYEYFKTNFNIIPQQFSDDLKDGFYSKKIMND